MEIMRNPRKLVAHTRTPTHCDGATHAHYQMVG